MLKLVKEFESSFDIGDISNSYFPTEESENTILEYCPNLVNHLKPIEKLWENFCQRITNLMISQFYMASKFKEELGYRTKMNYRKAYTNLYQDLKNGRFMFGDNVLLYLDYVASKADFDTLHLLDRDLCNIVNKELYEMYFSKIAQLFDTCPIFREKEIAVVSSKTTEFENNEKMEEYLGDLLDTVKDNTTFEIKIDPDIKKIDETKDPSSGVINLYPFVETNPQDNTSIFNIKKFVTQVYRAFYYLQILNSMDFEYSGKRKYNISLGITGFADTLIKLKYPYDSEKSKNFADLVSSALSGSLFFTIDVGLLNTKSEFVRSDFIGPEDESETFSKEYYKVTIEDKIRTLEIYLKSPDSFNCEEKFKIFKNYLIDGINLLFSYEEESFDTITDEKKEEIANLVYDAMDKRLHNILAADVRYHPLASNILGVFDSVDPISCDDRIFSNMHVKISDVTELQNNSNTDIPYLRTVAKLDLKKVLSVINSFASKCFRKNDTCLYLDKDDFKSNYQTYIDIIKRSIQPLVKIRLLDEGQTQPSSLEGLKEKNISWIEEAKKYQKDKEAKEERIQEINLGKDSINPELDTESITEDKSISTLEEEKESPEKHSEVTGVIRPEVLYGYTERTATPFGSMYVTANCLDDKIVECFVKLGKSGSEIQSYIEALTRVISIGLQNGVDINQYIQTMNGISGYETWVYGDSNGKEHVVKSIPDLLSKILQNLNTMSKDKKLS